MIQGVKEIKVKSFKDDRGEIVELFRDYPVKQVTMTISDHGVLRGLHVQDWDKVVYPAIGDIYMVLVDLRKDSPTYKEKWIDYINDENRKAYLIPKGVANSYACLSDVTYFYFNFENYDRKRTWGINYKDPDLDLIYPLISPLVSAKDKKAPFLKDL